MSSFLQNSKTCRVGWLGVLHLCYHLALNLLFLILSFVNFFFCLCDCVCLIKKSHMRGMSKVACVSS
jgi:hypothetical protein